MKLALIVLLLGPLAFADSLRLSETTDRSIGWVQLGAVGRSLADFDEYLAKLLRGPSMVPLVSRYRLLQVLAREAEKKPFQSGRILLPQEAASGLRCKGPVLSWEAEENLTTLRSLSVYFSGCGVSRPTRIFRVSWASRFRVNLTENASAVSLLFNSVGQFGNLGLAPSCQLTADKRGLSTIYCKDLSYSVSPTSDHVLKSVRFSRSGQDALKANGKIHRLLKHAGNINVRLENVPGAIAQVRQDFFKEPTTSSQPKKRKALAKRQPQEPSGELKTAVQEHEFHGRGTQPGVVDYEKAPEKEGGEDEEDIENQEAEEFAEDEESDFFESENDDDEPVAMSI